MAAFHTANQLCFFHSSTTTAAPEELAPFLPQNPCIIKNLSHQIISFIGKPEDSLCFPLTPLPQSLTACATPFQKKAKEEEKEGRKKGCGGRRFFFTSFPYSSTELTHTHTATEARHTSFRAYLNTVMLQLQFGFV